MYFGKQNPHSKKSSFKVRYFMSFAALQEFFMKSECFPTLHPQCWIN